MKRTIKLAVAAAVALTSTAAFATNGDNLIATGAKARGMGGVGIGMSHGAESGLSNPALISSVKGTEISFGGTVFMPDVETNMGTGGGSIKSDADLSVIPEVAIASRVSNNFTWGIGMYGVAGMGTDYRNKLDNFDAATTHANAMDAFINFGAGAAGGAIMGALAQGNFGMVTNLQLMQFAVPLAYNDSGFSIAIAPVLQYGSLDINYKLAQWLDTNADAVPDTVNLISGNTQGVAQDLGYGYTIGAAYETDGLTLGATYKSAINMEYKGQISEAVNDFSNGTLELSDNLEQPAEYGVGASYTMGEHTFAIDYKKIDWASAKGYKDFGWKDQDVYALGYQFAQDNYAIRVGYNHAKSAVVSTTDTLANTFNLLGFPATVEDHYTIGGTYALSKATSVDLAYVYADSTKDTFDNMLMSQTTTKHSQDAISAQVNFNF